MRGASFLTCVVLAVAACSPAQPAAVANAGPTQLRLFVTPGISGESNDLRIELRGPEIGEPVEADLDMPDMPMPVERVELTQDAAAYTAHGVRFSMAGTWRIRLVRKMSHAQAAVFTVRVR